MISQCATLNATEYTRTCGLAFEDLTDEEMIDFDGEATPLFFIGSFVASAAVTCIVTYIWW